MAGSTRIRGITIEIGGDTTGLEKALKGVDSALRETQSKLRDVQKLLKLDPANTELLTQKQKLLKDAVSETRDRLETLKQAQEQAKHQLESGDLGKDKYEALQREIIATEQELKKAEKALKDFGSVSAQQLKAVGSDVKAVGGKISGVGKELSKVSVPLVAAGTAAVKSFAEVDKTMQLTNSTMANSEEEARLLSDAMKEAAANSTFGMSDAAQASLNFARAGLTAEQAAAALAPAMNLAAGEGGNLDTVSGGLVATINGFHGSFEEAGHYADVFANACNNSALDVDGLSDAMSVAAPVFSAVGYAVEDAALYMGVMADNGIEADKAANSLKTGFARLVSPAKEGAEAMANLGWSILNENGTMKDSITIQKELHDKFAELSEAEQIAAASAIFGKNQMAPWLALINSAPADVSELAGALEKEGTASEMAGAMMSGFGGSIEKLKSSVDVAATSLGEALAPTIQAVGDKIQAAVDWFNGLDESQRSMIATIGLVVAAVGPALVMIGSVVSGIGSIISATGSVVGAVSGIPAAITAVKASFSGLSMVITAAGGVVPALGALVSAAAPFLIGGAVVAGIVAGGVFVYKHWDEIKAKASELKEHIAAKWEEMKAATSTKWQEMKSDTSEKWGSIANELDDKWNGMKQSLGNLLSEMASSSRSKWESMKSSWSGSLSEMVSSAQAKWESIKQTVSNGVERLKSLVNFNWSLPHISMPHFSISGSFSLNPPSVPYISVDWYKKAMDNGMILNGATIFGAAGGKLLGGGEAGPEAVVGVSSLLGMIQEAVRSVSAPKVDMGGVSINVYATENQSAREIAEEVEEILSRKVMRQSAVFA